MSTEHQQYSFDNQKDAIALYAEHHGFAITKTYDDAAKTGVVLKVRSGLKRLLQDVLSGSAEYKAILVYDISRWGRFQDTDEAAHYEFLCKHAGIPVHYCAEPFRNDDSTASMIMKALKRTMAGEYSRELSVKCYAGQKRIAQLGFIPGASPAYGFRRLVVSPDGTRIFKPGEQKYVRGDRTTLCLGPKAEVEGVRTIYRLFTRSRGQLGPTAISRELKRRGIKLLPGKTWDLHWVYRILRNPRYAGYNVWNRTQQKLGSTQRRNPREQWVVVPNAFPAIIRPQQFERAQELLKNRPRKFSEQYLLKKLTSLLRRKGRITKKIMEHCRGMPDRSCYLRYFGGMQKAYDLIGYKYPAKRFMCAGKALFTKQLRNHIIRQLLELFPQHVALAPGTYPERPALLIDKTLKVYVITCRFNTKSHNNTWLLRSFPRDRNTTITLLCLLNRTNSGPSLFVVVPRITSSSENEHSFGLTDDLLSGGERLNGLQEFYTCVMRVRRQLVAGFL